MTQFSNLNLPYGAQIGGSVVLPYSAGKVLYVGSTVASARDAANQGLTPQYPLATIDYAIGLCTADVGDIILVLPGHAETIAVARGITCDVAGISIIGLGNGLKRPIITWSASASTWIISAANVTIKNILTRSSFNECILLFSVTGVGVTLDGVDFYATAGALEARAWLDATTAASHLTIKNCRHVQPTAAAAAQAWITLTTTSNSRIIDNSFFLVAYASTSSIAITAATTCLQLEIARNNIVWAGATVTKIMDVGASTGIICDNRMGGGAQITAAAAITGTAAFVSQNFCLNNATWGSGLLAPAAGAYT